MGETMRTLGIILAAGKSTRLYPSTFATTKQLLPVYDKPLIYYPLTTLMLMGIRDFAIITTPSESVTFKKLFENAETELGITITFLVQEHATGIAEAFNIVHDHFHEHIYDYDNHALILGDNIFYGAGLQGLLKTANVSDGKHSKIFLYPVQTPQNFGVAVVKNNKVVNVEEKPVTPKSNLAITGLYFYPPSVYLYVKQITPSARGELEVTDLNNYYLKLDQLEAVQLPRGMVWFDTGNVESLLEASNFIHNIQKHQNYLVGSPHEVAFLNGWITKEQLSTTIDRCEKTDYGRYLKKLREDTL
jgi:glucose-1-phosphate thymidylyltransferase